MRLLTTRVTSLEMRAVPKLSLPRPRVEAPIVVTEHPRIALETYRTLYRAVGRPHHWTSRLLSDMALRQEIHRPAVRIFVMTVGGVAAGWFELETSPDRTETRIVHFGILPNHRGMGLAPFLLAHAIHTVFDTDVRRLTIETNTLDHPSALPLYLKLGFHAFAARTVETPSFEQAERRTAGSHA